MITTASLTFDHSKVTEHRQNKKNMFRHSFPVILLKYLSGIETKKKNVPQALWFSYNSGCQPIQIRFVDIRHILLVVIFLTYNLVSEMFILYTFYSCRYKF